MLIRPYLLIAKAVMTLQRSEDSTVYNNEAFEEGEAGAARLSIAQKSVAVEPESEAEVLPSSFRSLYRSAIS